MAASFPTSIKEFTTKEDAVTDVLAAHVNDLQAEVVAVETALGAGMANVPTAATGSFLVMQAFS
jgi:hypothetical protein